MFVGKARSLPRVEHLKGTSICLALALLANIRLGWKNLVRDKKHSGLLLTLVKYGCKKTLRKMVIDKVN
jgi:hypothetical protein